MLIHTIEIAKQLNDINNTLGQIQDTLANPPFWQSNIFAATVGFLSGLLVFVLDLLIRFHDKRKKSLNGIYEWITNQWVFYSPDALVDKAKHTSYAHFSIKNGATTQIPEKPFADRMRIEFKKTVKYWTFPRFSKIRRLLRRYDQEISTFPEYNDPDISERIRRAEVIHRQIEEYVYQKTGENEFTA